MHRTMAEDICENAWWELVGIGVVPLSVSRYLYTFRFYFKPMLQIDMLPLNETYEYTGKSKSK